MTCARWVSTVLIDMPRIAAISAVPVALGRELRDLGLARRQAARTGLPLAPAAGEVADDLARYGRRQV